MMVKSNIGAHGGSGNPPLDFNNAYQAIQRNPNQIYYTTGNNAPFTAIATTVKKGSRINERVIRFMSDGQERARSYYCCWPYSTNCNKTHIDCYTEAVM